jgi:hypothetical protein
MHLSFDHLVHFSPDPIKAQKELNEYGINVIKGGIHEKWGTFNTLAYFNLSYIEWLGLRDIALAQNVTDNDLIQQLVNEHTPLGHFGRFALRTDDMDLLIKELESKNVTVKGPVAGSRQTNDGERLQWKMCFIEADHDSLPLPFFIEWGEPEEKRKPKLADLSSHPAGQLQLKNIYCAVHNLEESISKWTKLLDVQSGESYKDSLLDARCQKLYVNGGNLIFCSGTQGVVHDTLKKVGERPFLVELDHALTPQQITVQGASFKFNK